MTRQLPWLLAGLFVLFFAAAPAFAAGAGAAPADWEAAFKSRCEARGMTADACDKRLQAIKARREARLNKMREECKAHNIANDAECRTWYRKQHTKVGNVYVRAKSCKAQGLTPEQCQAKRKEMREKRQAEYEKFQADCKAKGIGERECRRQFRQAQRSKRGTGAGITVTPGSGTVAPSGAGQ